MAITGILPPAKTRCRWTSPATPHNGNPNARQIVAQSVKVSRRQVLAWGAVGGASLVGLDAIAYEPRAIRFQALEYPVRGLGRAFDGYRVAFVTDVHYPRHITRPFIKKCVDTALEFCPDLLLYGGDFVDGHDLLGVGKNNAPSLAGMFEGTAPDGVFGVLGNHDWWLNGESTRAEIERCTPIRLLENDHALIRRGNDALALGGLEDLWCRHPNLTSALGTVDPEIPRLLLSHNPDVAERCAGAARVDLQLSGHTHGGEVRLPFYGPLRIPSRYGRKFERGLVEGALHPVYVSVGVASPRAVRFNCRPEVTGITLRCA
ncbi:MAG: hypothetical protein C4320_09525 [Armatimonadota bacterium]